MRKFLRRGLLFSIVLALALPLAACDSGGSNDSGDSSLAWVGDWEVTSVNGTSVPEDNAFFELSVERLSAINPTSNGCDISTNQVLDRDGDKLTFDIPEGTEEVTLDVSDGTLTITVLESDDPDSDPGDELAAKSIDDARAEAGC